MMNSPAEASNSKPAAQQRLSGGLAIVTQRPIAITMFVVAMAVFGIVSFFKLNVDLLPEISYPSLTVRTTWEGAAPEDIEERVSERVQEALGTLPNLVRSTSISRAGTSDVLLDFNWGTAMTFAVQDVREKLDSVFLPRDVERPLILRYDPNLDPILRVGMRSTQTASSNSDLIHLRWLAENRIKRELEATPGIAAVLVRGGLEEEIKIQVDPFKLAAHNLDLATVANRLAQENINASGGSVREGSTEYLVRTLNEFKNIEEIADLAILRRGDAAVRVRDVALVERNHVKREVISRLGGGEMVELSIYREAGANVVQLSEEIKKAVFGTASMQATAKEIMEREASGGGGARFDERSDTDFIAYSLRKDAELELLSDQSTFIRAAVDDVRNAAVFGSILAIAVIWVFLRRLSATFIIGLAIPISVVVTFAPMQLFGVSLNIMSLGGLALGVGMLVDNAIVVLESITRCREEGDSLQFAAVRGVREVAGAVIASTLTTLAVFAPIVFVSGIAGQIFGDQALTVVTSLMVSLIVAVLFLPMLASRQWLVGHDSERSALRKPRKLLSGMQWRITTLIPNLLQLASRLFLLVTGFLARALALIVGLIYKAAALVLTPFSRAFDRFWLLVESIYSRLLSVSLAHPLIIVLIGLGLLGAAGKRVSNLGLELLPEIHQGEFTAHVTLDIGNPLEFTDESLSELDAVIRRLEGVRTTALTVGVEPETLTRDIEGPHTARLTVRLEDDYRDPLKEEGVVEGVRTILHSHPAVNGVEIRRPTPFALEAPIAVEIKGHNLEEIERVADLVYKRLEKVPGLQDLRSSMRPGHPEVLVSFDRDKILEYGLDLGAVANLVRDQVLGNVSTRFNEGEERIDVRVIGDEVVLSNLNSVMDLVVNPMSEKPVPLRAVARDPRIVQGPAEIRRIGNTRGVVITAEGSGLDLGGLNTRIEAALADLSTSDDVIVELGGQKREMEEAQNSMRFALLLAVFLVYVVMASQFESLLQPLVILLTVPLAGVGVIFTLEMLEIPLSVVVFIGLIMLAGIVVNNAIVLVDRINQKRDQGLELLDAVREAGRARLRPILMTTATTALGLLPMTGWLAGVPVVGVLGAGEGAEMRAPMAITVIAGLLAATLLTLIVIPTVYSLLPGRRNRQAFAQ